MENNDHKTNLKFKLHIETQSVSNSKEIDLIVDFYVNIEELSELVNYLREHRIDPKSIKFKEIESSESPIIFKLYDTAFDIAFEKHLKDLMWAEEDFYDEAKYFMHTDDLDRQFAHYDMNTDLCDSEEEYYDKVRMNESIMSEYNNRHEESINFLRRAITSKDIIEFKGIVCELI